MSKLKQTPDYIAPEAQEQALPEKKAKKKQKQRSGALGRIIRRFFLVLFTLILLLVGGLVMVLDLVFTGPSVEARNMLTMSLIEASATKWVPALFIGEEAVAEIREKQGKELPNDVANVDAIVINKDTMLTVTDEWKDHPDGIRIESYKGDTFNAHIMVIRDPSRVYCATSTDKFSLNTLGTRISDQIETEGAVAGINAGSFNDDGTGKATNGSLPLGLVYSEGECLWTSGTPNERGYAGFTEDHVLVVAKEMTKAKAEELGIRDMCGFGPVLIMDGEFNETAYNTISGLNPRTAIGQRKDGAVIFVCIDGRQTGSLGGEYADIIDIMVEYGAYNACNMDGGSSAVMLYRDNYGLYGEAGKVQMINSYSLLQEEPRRMPTFWMVRPGSEE